MLGREKLVMRISGKMNESAEFDMIRLPKSESLEIDLVDLTLINSMGIRIFKDWVHRLEVPSLFFSYCPRIFIDQVNMVVDFIPKTSTIQSFYVPYYNEDSEEERNVLFVRNEHFKMENGEPVITFPDVKDSKGREMEIDVIAEKYFAFIKKF